MLIDLTTQLSGEDILILKCMTVKHETTSNITISKNIYNNY